MPWHITKVKGGFKVITDATGKPHSNKAMSKEEALAQLAVLNMKLKKGLIK
jgi:hypothetical protein